MVNSCSKLAVLKFFRNFLKNPLRCLINGSGIYLLTFSFFRLSSSFPFPWSLLWHSSYQHLNFGWLFTDIFISNFSDRNNGQWSVKTDEKMKNTGENYLKFPKKPGENLRKNQKKCLWIGFFKNQWIFLIDYHHSLLVIHGPISHIEKTENSRPNYFYFSNLQNRKLLLASRKFQKNCKLEHLC